MRTVHIVFTLLLCFDPFLEMAATASTNIPSSNVVPLIKTTQDSGSFKAEPTNIRLDNVDESTVSYSDISLSSFTRELDPRGHRTAVKTNFLSNTIRVLAHKLPLSAVVDERSSGALALQRRRHVFNATELSLIRRTGTGDEVSLGERKALSRNNVNIPKTHIIDPLKRQVSVQKDPDVTEDSSSAGFHRLLVRRASALITTDCGPLGSRCNYVPRGECVLMCVNSQNNRRVCKIQLRDSRWACLVASV